MNDDKRFDKAYKAMDKLRFEWPRYWPTEKAGWAEFVTLFAKYRKAVEPGIVGDCARAAYYRRVYDSMGRSMAYYQSLVDEAKQEALDARNQRPAPPPRTSRPGGNSPYNTEPPAR